MTSRPTTDARRILITGLSGWRGGRLAQVLEREPGVETVIGVDTEDPRHELARTEFVRLDVTADVASLRRILSAARIDTVVDTRLIVDPLLAPVARAHEVNIAGTRAVLEASGAARVAKLVFSSSALYYGSAAGDPAFFTEDMRRTGPARAAIERDVLTAETAVAEFAARHGNTTVTILRAADPLGAEVRSSYQTLLGLPVVPAILGFDPRVQFIHEEDAIGALAHVTRHRLSGAYNAAGDGVLALSELASLLGRPLVPALPPWGTGFAAVQLRRLGLRVPVELVAQLRYGRGLDNRRLKASGYGFRYTTREAVLQLRAQQRLRPLLRRGSEPYRYAREVEEFLRWSRSVPPATAADEATETAPADPTRALHGYDALSPTEVIEIITSLEPEDLARLREYEAANRARTAVLAALDRNLQRLRAGG